MAPVPEICVRQATQTDTPEDGGSEAEYELPANHVALWDVPLDDSICDASAFEE